jgi:hypothetical protein
MKAIIYMLCKGGYCACFVVENENDYFKQKNETAIRYFEKG